MARWTKKEQGMLDWVITRLPRHTRQEIAERIRLPLQDESCRGRKHAGNKEKRRRGRPLSVDVMDAFRVWISVEALRRNRRMSISAACGYLATLKGNVASGSRASASRDSLRKLYTLQERELAAAPNVRAYLEAHFDEFCADFIDQKVMAALPLRR
jgi:hypothetical protein